MDLQSLKDKKAKVEEQFNANSQQASQIEDEQKRLQGEYRLLDSLIKEAGDPATTIVAEPKEDTSGKRSSTK